MKKQPLFPGPGHDFRGRDLPPWVVSGRPMPAASVAQTFFDPLPSGAATLRCRSPSMRRQIRSTQRWGPSPASVVITTTTNVAGQLDVISLNQTPPNRAYLVVLERGGSNERDRDLPRWS